MVTHLSSFASPTPSWPRPPKRQKSEEKWESQCKIPLLSVSHQQLVWFLQWVRKLLHFFLKKLVLEEFWNWNRKVHTGLRSYCPMGKIIPIPSSRIFGVFLLPELCPLGREGGDQWESSAEKQESSCARNADLWLAPGDDPTRRTSPSGSWRRRPPGVGTPRWPWRAQGIPHSHSQSSAAAGWQLCPGSWWLASSPFRCAVRRETKDESGVIQPH